MANYQKLDNVFFDTSFVFSFPAEAYKTIGGFFF